MDTIQAELDSEGTSYTVSRRPANATTKPFNDIAPHSIPKGANVGGARPSPSEFRGVRRESETKARGMLQSALHRS